jgi:hypothetical protein
VTLRKCKRLTTKIVHLKPNSLKSFWDKSFLLCTKLYINTQQGTYPSRNKALDSQSESSARWLKRSPLWKTKYRKSEETVVCGNIIKWAAPLLPNVGQEDGKLNRMWVWKHVSSDSWIFYSTIMALNFNN